MRETTKEKQRRVVNSFQRMLRGKQDLTVSYMYTEAGRPCFLTAETAGNIVRKHYKEVITPEMKSFVKNLNGAPHEKKIESFSEKFGLCHRESRLIIRYIHRSK